MAAWGMLRTALIVIFLLVSSACMSSAKYPESDHYNGETFSNQSGSRPKSFTDLLKWWTEEKAEWPKKIKLEPQLPLLEKDKLGEDIHLSFINHASFLIRTSRWSLMTDPHFSERASPLSFAGPKRVHPPAIALEQIQELDYVFISHNHYDHLDLPSLKRIQKKFPAVIFLVPLGNERLLKREGLNNIQIADWWQGFAVNGPKLDLVPAEHWSARGLFDRNENLWGGLMLRWKDRSIYFAGDTGYGVHYKQIRERLGEPDIALLPIGAYEPRWFMKNQHMNPADSVQAHLDLKADLSIGMHLGCFQLTNESIDQPQIDLLKALDEQRIKHEDFVVLKPGQTATLKL